ncbi:DUF262 domain-containing protein [Lewinella sp. 4G2]|uniref:DUF262 domain-containing protein n=1 Tax=Lewinella sp. 4G2 TaxID=1803372 RepID=UPI0007E26BFA|nr:DUF262 domain-containing protein [Lewinella sp. 4G2]OAV45809.1 hypothetical protein A3850_005385 [Lewinella sp. 4G2]
MKDSQTPGTFHLGQLITRIKKGHFVIPDFQREFAWMPWDVRDLIQSIFTDYYIGTMLLWESTPSNLETLSCEGVYGFTDRLNPEYIVLDGQQRLTAMHYAFFAPDIHFPKRAKPVLYWIKLRELLAGNMDEAFYYNSATRYYRGVRDDVEQQYDNHLFPLSTMGGGSWAVGDWIKGYRDYWRERAESATDSDEVNEAKVAANSAEVLKELFEDLLDNYQISYIALNRELEVGKVCDIFTHINSRGVKLDIFDLLNAITRPKDIFLKQMNRDAATQLAEYYPNSLKNTYILMVMSLMAQNYCSPKYLYYLVPGQEKTIRHKDGSKENITLVKDAAGFRERWDYALKALVQGLKKLKNPRDYGAISDKLLPYPSIIPVFSAIQDYALNAPEVKQRAGAQDMVKRWYWSSIISSRYSSSVESTSAQDFIAMKRWFADETAVPDSIQEFDTDFSRLNLIQQDVAGSAVYVAIFNLFIIDGARDWHTFDLPEYDALDDHHIVPKSWGKQNNIDRSINSVLNRTLITPDTNRKVLRDRLPNEYLAELLDANENERAYQVLESHLISRRAVEILLRKPFTPDDYQAFLRERQATIKRRLRLELIPDETQTPLHLRQYDLQIEDIELRLRELLITTLSVTDADVAKRTVPSHLVPKVQRRIEREAKKNPALFEEQGDSAAYWFQFLDLQELKDIMLSKQHWSLFEGRFGSKTVLANEFSDLGNLRNGIRHSRSIDPVTEKKGQGAILWFEQQIE